MDKRYFWVYIILTLLCILTSSIHFGTVRDDSKGYMDLLETLHGDNNKDLSFYAARPLTIFLVYPLEPLLGAHFSFGIINLLLLIATSFLIFHLFKNFLKSSQKGFLVSIIYVLSFPVMVWGTKVLTDQISHFFLVLLIYVIEYKLKKIDIETALYLFLLFSLAFLARESLVLIFIYLLFHLFFNYKRLNITIAKLIPFLIIVGLSVLPYLIWIKLMAVQSVPVYSPLKMNLFELFKVYNYVSFGFRAAIAFHILLIPFFFGLFKQYTLNQKQYFFKLFFFIFPTIFIHFVNVPTFVSPRLCFLLFPLIIPIAVEGLHINPDSPNLRLIIVFITIYALISLVGSIIVPNMHHMTNRQIFDAILGFIHGI